MKMATGNVNTIERVGVGADQEFTIDFSAKMASILADGLYSDKIQSVIRELSCNAYDSHVAAGHADKPIEVHFPNRFEPWFHVRDFGTGLSHDEVMSIYTRYGASTKTNSNEFIGALGLGSKSPFALTEAFTVTSRKDGIENHYSMYRNEQGMPSVAHLHQTVTNEPNGVMVKVPVRDDQRNEFIEKSKKVYKWFPVKPTTIGDTINYDTVNYDYTGTGWGICKPTYDNRYGYRHSYYAKPVAIMGLVAYPLDANSIKGLSEGAKALFETPLVLTFGIGELEIAANREALGYDERTCAAIVAKMATVIAELGSEFETKISTAKTLWEAKKTFGKIFKAGDYSHQFTGVFNKLGLTWNNVVIKDDYANFVPSDLYGTNAANFSLGEIHECNYRYKRCRAKQFGDNETFDFRINDDAIIVFNDLKTGGLTRVSLYRGTLSQADDKRIYVFGPSTKSTFDQIQNALGNPEVIMTSSLPKPERKKVERTGMLKYTGGYSGKKAWEEVLIDLDLGGYYVDLDTWDTVWNGTAIDINWWLRVAKDANLIQDDVVVYAMRNKNKKIVNEHDGWFNLIDTIKSKLEDLIKQRNVSEEIANASEYSKLIDASRWKFWDYELELAIKDTTSPMLAFIHNANSFKYTTKGLGSIQSLMNKFEMTIESAACKVNLVEEYRKIMQRYPMLAFANERYSYSYNRPDHNNLRTIYEYINYIDTTAVFVALQDDEAEETH